MVRRLGFLVFAMITIAIPALPAWCGAVSGSGSGAISGYVRDAGGIPQMGAAVEILGSAAQALKVFTDERGFYSVASLLPGSYSLKVSAPAFLPSLREKIGVRAGSRQMVNITLTTLFEAIQLVPTHSPVDDDDWKWTLRSVANRPILRVLDDGTTVVAQSGESASDRDLKGSVSLLAGSPAEGFGSSNDMTAGFAVERSLLSSGTLRLNGNVGYDSDGQGIPSAILRTSYTNRFNGMFEPSVSITALRLNSLDLNAMPGALQALSVTSADRVVFGDMLEMKAGSELQAIQFMGRVNAFKPFGSVDLHLTPDTLVEYQYASSVPHPGVEERLGGAAGDDGLGDSAASDLSQTAPRMSITAFAPAVEKAHHQELSISHRMGKNSMQVAFYADNMIDPVLTGVGEVSAESGEVLPDVYSGTFNYQGNNFSSRGMRVVLQRKLLSDLSATLDYAYGNALDLSRPDIQLQDARSWIRAERRQAMAAKLSGTVPKSKTRWIASYRHAASTTLTPVDLFNTSPGAVDPYLSLCIRQPIPASFFAGHLEILMDLRNLLAQGYVPVLGSDGHTVYLVQSVRSARGGVEFSF